MEFYPQYKIDDFFHKHVWEGGLTLSQVHTLYVCAMRRKNDEYRFYALLHGHDLDKDKNNKSKTSSQRRQQQQSKQSLPIFGDPEEYKNMSKEERDNLTQKMMKQHQTWAKSSTGKKIGR